MMTSETTWQTEG